MNEELSRIDINGVTYYLLDENTKATAVTQGRYNSSNQRIELLNANNNVVSFIDATNFIKDGMVSNVSIVNGNLVIAFNTDSGKSPISIPLTSIFNPSNYYQKSEIDSKLAEKQSEISNLESTIGYYECSSEASSASKTIAASNYVLRNGGNIKVKMTNANTANNATLNINSTGVKPLFYDGERASAKNSWEAGEVVEVFYDGTSFYANNVAGGGKFSTGEKVKEVGIDDEPTAGSDNFVKSGGVQNELALGAVYDVSAKNPTAGPNNDGKFESLSALLSDANLNTLIPTAVRKGGMSIKFVQSSDNKYVQYRYTGTAVTGEPNPFLDTSNWLNIDGQQEIELLTDSVNIKPNTLYKLGNRRNLTVSFIAGESMVVNEYMFQFTVTGDSFSLTLPAGVRWFEEPDFNDGSTYQVSVVDNLAIIAEWEATNE